MKNRKKAFTLTEMIVVVTIIGVLMMGITTYIGGADEKTKIIEAQGCAATLGGEINNYVYYALTSKILNGTSPNFYTIGLESEQSSIKCTKGNNSDCTLYKNIVLSYGTPITTYKTINPSNTCRQAKPELRFYRLGTTSNNIDYIKMNKGFSPQTVNEVKVFYLQGKNNSNVKDLLGDIIIVLCLDNECSAKKQVAKRSVDGRSQTISLKRCRYYEDDNSGFCKARDDCKVYNSDDPTACDSYY